MRTRKLTSPLSSHRHQLLQRYLYQEHQGTSNVTELYIVKFTQPFPRLFQNTKILQSKDE